jgi:hypothetical protein
LLQHGLDELEVRREPVLRRVQRQQLRARLMDGDLFELMVAAHVIEVMMGVHDQKRIVGQSFDYRPDARDPEPGVEQHRPLRTDDQIAVDVHRLADQMNALTQALGGKPGRVAHAGSDSVTWVAG